MIIELILRQLKLLDNEHSTLKIKRHNRRQSIRC